MIGVSFMGEVGEEMMTERYNISSFFYLLTSTWWPKRTLMDPPESSTFSPSEVLTISVGILTRNVWISPNQSTMARRRPTLQAAGVEFNQELGLWFGHQSGHAVHDLNPPFGFTVRVWEEARNGVTAEYDRQNCPFGDHTLLGNKLRGHSNLERCKNRWMVTCRDVSGTPCKFQKFYLNICVINKRNTCTESVWDSYFTPSHCLKRQSGSLEIEYLDRTVTLWPDFCDSLPYFFFVIFYEKYIQEVCVEEEWLTVSVADSVNQRVGFLQDTVAPRRKVVFCL